jgi:hypothetical protein
MSRGELEKLKYIDINEIDPEDLQELSEVRLHSDLPVQERLELFLCQIRNPYCFKVNGTPVQVSFSDGRKTLEEALNNYLTNRRDYDRM